MSSKIVSAIVSRYKEAGVKDRAQAYKERSLSEIKKSVTHAIDDLSAFEHSIPKMTGEIDRHLKGMDDKPNPESLGAVQGLSSRLVATIHDKVKAEILVSVHRFRDHATSEAAAAVAELNRMGGPITSRIEAYRKVIQYNTKMLNRLNSHLPDTVEALDEEWDSSIDKHEDRLTSAHNDAVTKFDDLDPEIKDILQENVQAIEQAIEDFKDALETAVNDVIEEHSSYVEEAVTSLYDQLTEKTEEYTGYVGEMVEEMTSESSEVLGLVKKHLEKLDSV